MLKEPVSITGIASLSALGSSAERVYGAYGDPKSYLTRKKVGHQEVWVAQLPKPEKELIQALRHSDAKYKNLDDTVLYAIYTARKAVEKASWGKDEFNGLIKRQHVGINIGSSRGATGLFEKYHQQFLHKGKTVTLASPTTTLGNISTWVAHDLQTKGPVISHSITCSTALHALLNAVAWLQAGMANAFLVGGSEAPLTSFTIAQMQALKIYSQVQVASGQDCQKSELNRVNEPKYPCRALDLQKNKNTLVLGEGAAMACLEKGRTKNALAQIIGVGYATEVLTHNVSISAEAQCFQDSMRMALGNHSTDSIDAIVLHAPGTVKGDSSEVAAIEKVFCNKIPFLTTNKWKVGHTFGASGMLSIEMAIFMLTHQNPIPVPFVDYDTYPKNFQRILVNAVGFGGNAVSILLEAS